MNFYFNATVFVVSNTILYLFLVIFPFIQIFQKIISEDKNENQSTEQRVLTAASINITVNRKYLYQDAFDQLSQDRADDVKKVIRVQMVNAQGLEEAGIDGGGVFRFGIVRLFIYLFILYILFYYFIIMGEGGGVNFTYHCSIGQWDEMLGGGGGEVNLSLFN